MGGGSGVGARREGGRRKVGEQVSTGVQKSRKERGSKHRREVKHTIRSPQQHEGRVAVAGTSAKAGDPFEEGSASSYGPRTRTRQHSRLHAHDQL